MTTESTAQAEQKQSKSRLGSPTVSAGIFRLWEYASNRLAIEELRWFAGYVDEAERETQNLSNVIMDIGCLIGADTDAGNFRDQSSVSTLLFNISHQLDTINGMIFLGASAEYCLQKSVRYSREDVTEGGVK